ncbi:MAG: hypothetical protein GX640_07495 [Fibrobacter sp.]|nr:hypothetical protein [Fibrobacter sp.]
MYSENYYSFNKSRSPDDSNSEYKSIIEKLQTIHDALIQRSLHDEADKVKEHIDFISNALLYTSDPRDIDNLFQDLASEFLNRNVNQHSGTVSVNNRFTGV